MDINDYLIAQPGNDWPELLSGWLDSLPASFTLWMVNRLGDLVVVYEDETVHILDVGAGRIELLADNRDHFCSLLDQEGNADNWLMIPLVDACVAAGLILGPSQCYGYKVPPLLGGEYAVDNIEVADLAVHFAYLADIHRRIQDVPDGTPVRIVASD